MKAFLLKDRQAFLILFILFLFIAICRINFPDLDHGDAYTDANVLNAGENFIRFGFIKCKFLPVFEPNLNSPSGAYTHYPPLPDIINGLLRAVFRIDSLYFFRAVSLFCSLINLFFWYLFVKLLTNHPLIALVSAVFYLSNPLFIFGMDSLHESCYSELLRSLIFFTLIFITSFKKRKGIIFLWVLVFLQSLITFEYIIYLCVFFALFRLIFNSQLNNKVTWKDVLILFSAPIAGFLLHFLQNVWYFGSYAAALQDLTRSAIQRIVSDNTFTMTFNLWWEEVVLKNISLTFLYTNKELLLYTFFSYLLYLRLKNQLHKKDKRLIISLAKLLFILIICGVSWYVFFPMHSLDHNNVTFLARHLLPAAVITSAIFFYMLFIYISARKVNTSWKHSLLMIIPIIFSIFIVIKGINESELPITPVKIGWAHSFLMIKQELLHLKKISSNRDTIGLNIYRFPFIRYYTNRHCQYIATRPELISLPQLPRYFIYVNLGNYSPEAKANELLNALIEKYKPISFQRMSFPFLFLELKNKE